MSTFSKKIAHKIHTSPSLCVKLRFGVYAYFILISFLFKKKFNKTRTDAIVYANAVIINRSRSIFFIIRTRKYCFLSKYLKFELKKI